MHGRISRSQYFIGKIILILFLLVNSILAYGLFTMMQGPANAVVVFLLSTVVFGLIVAFFVSNFIITVKRFHDFNQSGWVTLFCIIFIYVMTNIIPPVGAILEIILSISTLLIP